MFCARYCGKCRALTRRLNELKPELEDIIITNYDVEKVAETIDEYFLEGIPTLIYFEDDQEVRRLLGSIYPEDIRGLINERK